MGVNNHKGKGDHQNTFWFIASSTKHYFMLEHYMQWMDEFQAFTI